MRLATVILIVVVEVGCATGAVPVADLGPSPGDPCPHDGFIRIEDGIKFIHVDGRLVSSSQTPPSFRRAQLLYWEQRDNHRANRPDFEASSDGTFKAIVGLDWSRHVSCQSGKVVASEHLSSQQLLVRVHGCSDAKFEVGEKWAPREIEVSCS